MDLERVIAIVNGDIGIGVVDTPEFTLDAGAVAWVAVASHTGNIGRAHLLEGHKACLDPLHERCCCSWIEISGKDG